jgi:hypothetical protein
MRASWLLTNTFYIMPLNSSNPLHFIMIALVITITKSRMTRRENVLSTVKKNAYKDLFLKLKGKRLLCRSRANWQDHIKIYILKVRMLLVNFMMHYKLLIQAYVHITTRCYNLEGGLVLKAAMRPLVNSASERNEYQEFS